MGADSEKSNSGNDAAACWDARWIQLSYFLLQLKNQKHTGSELVVQEHSAAFNPINQGQDGTQRANYQNNIGGSGAPVWAPTAKMPTAEMMLRLVEMHDGFSHLICYNNLRTKLPFSGSTNCLSRI